MPSETSVHRSTVLNKEEENEKKKLKTQAKNIKNEKKSKQK
jgi:hypothetical protein